MTDIWIAGLGLQTAAQVTREVEHALRASNEVLYLDTGVATGPFLAGLCQRVTSLYEESYCEDGSRVSAYEHIAVRVVDAALDHPPVTFAIHGHPLIAEALGDPVGQRFLIFHHQHAHQSMVPRRG